MIRVGVVVYPGFQLLTLAVVSVFEYANMSLAQPLYAHTLLSEHGGPVASSCGVQVGTVPFSGARYDTVLVVGDTVVTQGSPGMLAFLRRSARRARRLGAACTGAFNLAQAGLLEGRRATTHWAHVAKMRHDHPDVQVEEDSIFVQDGSVWTSAGASACIDLGLALVEEDAGPDIARLVAKRMVVYHRRTGGQSQHSALLELQPRTDRIQKALSYAKSHLAHDLSVEELAEAASLSPRQFGRVFREETGQTPAKAVERLRTEAARLMIESQHLPVETVAKETGFGDPDRMRRAFLRAYGQPPQVIRRANRADARRA
ncbi:GlxA family transcriptional regulator [Pseudorhodoferax sp.]|uniref:GlxA family transcriptional regulator n=1 Tax=Pseudorhodoferax sp. TaxID=1993553 RepID=UPI002DD631E4|nr:GlxA family transcriptional regulator [Pseudorhodoferax sp.]